MIPSRECVHNTSELERIYIYLHWGEFALRRAIRHGHGSRQWLISVGAKDGVNPGSVAASRNKFRGRNGNGDDRSSGAGTETVSNNNSRHRGATVTVPAMASLWEHNQIPNNPSTIGSKRSRTVAPSLILARAYYFCRPGEVGVSRG